MSFKLPALPYAYNALEPHIDAKTMEIHHGKHHQGYTTKLNAAIEGAAAENQSIEEILQGLDMSSEAVRNNGGGYYNHCLFWEVLSPNGGGLPSDDLAQAIVKALAPLKTLKLHFPMLRPLNLVQGGLGSVFNLVGNLRCVEHPTKTIHFMPEV